MNKQPLSILEATGKKHLTKAEKQERLDSEIHLPDGEIVCPDYIKTNSAAFKKWQEVSAVLVEAELLKPADVGTLARYCMAFAEYLDLVEIRNQVLNLDPFSFGEEVEITNELDTQYGTVRAKQMWKKVDFIFSSQGVLAFDKAINQKLQVLLQYEDHLFLNLLARVKNILKKPEKQQTPSEKMGLNKKWA